VADNGMSMAEEVRRTRPVGKGAGPGLGTISGFPVQSRGLASIDSQPARPACDDSSRRRIGERWRCAISGGSKPCSCATVDGDRASRR